MLHRKRKRVWLRVLFALALVLGGLGLASAIFPHRLALLATLALVTSVADALWLAGRIHLGARTERRINAAVQRITEEHIDALARRHLHLRPVDGPGGAEPGRWDQELNHFIATKIAPALSRGQQRALKQQQFDVARRIEDRIAIAVANRPALPLAG